MSALTKLKGMSQPKEAKAKASTVVEVEVSNDVRKQVDEFVEDSRKLKELQVRVDTNKAVIREVGKAHVEELNVEGTQTKSIAISGKDSKVRVTCTDKFSVLNDAQEEIKTVLKDKYNDVIEERLSVSLKPEIIADEAMLALLLKKFSEAELKTFFDISTQLKTKKGFDQLQYTLTPTQRNVLRQSVVQAEPSVTVVE